MDHYCFSAAATLESYSGNSCTESPIPVFQAAIFHTDGPSSHRPQSWVDQRVPVVFAPHFKGGDPFDHTPREDKYGEIEEICQRVFDQITETADFLFATQQRVFLFMLLVVGRTCRVLRWDRAGIITTPAADYYEAPGILRDYLWRLSSLDGSAVGFDPSARRVLPGDIDFLRMDFAALQNPDDADHTERTLAEGDMSSSHTFAYVRKMFRDSLAPDWPRYELQVPDGDECRRFLVGKPIFQAEGVLGRGTRGYVALDCRTRRFVWLKDAWRAAYMLDGREGDVLQKLNETKVENVPTLICHGDVLGQRTVAADWWESTRVPSAIPSTSSTSTHSSRSSSRTLVGETRSGKRQRREDMEDDADPGPRSKGRLIRNATAHSVGPLREHKHYRFVVEEVAMSLKEFRKGKQLASVVYDAIQGT